MTTTTKMTGLTSHQVAALYQLCDEADDVTFHATASTFTCDMGAGLLRRRVFEAIEQEYDAGRRQALHSVRRKLDGYVGVQTHDGTGGYEDGGRPMTMADAAVAAAEQVVAQVTSPARPYRPESNTGAITSTTLGAGSKR